METPIETCQMLTQMPPANVSTPLCGYVKKADQVPAAVRALLEHCGLLHDVPHLGLAVSGGADSVALFHLMLPLCREAQVAVSVLHFDHGLRKESAVDADFVRELATTAHVPFISERANLATDVREGVSLEMAARTARMAFFNRCCTSSGLAAVATGHHADDVAETLLLRLARGAGATGLSGLRPCSHLTPTLRFIRPLLTLSNLALRDWLTQNSYTWREDRTNGDATIPRNFIRHTLLPQLERTWIPDLRARLCQSAEALREDDALLAALAQRARASVCSNDALNVVLLRQHPEALQRRILRQWLFDHNQPEASGLATVLALLQQCHGADDWQYQLPGGRLAICQAGLLSTGPLATPVPDEAPVPIPGRLHWGDVDVLTEASHGAETRAEGGVGHYPALCTLSAQALRGQTLCVRSRRPGDRIAPTGLDGSKKIQDLFVDEKVPERQRNRIPLFVCGDEVVWVPGYRIARAFAVPTSDAPSIRVTVLS